MIYIGDRVKNKFVVVCEKANGRWELWNLIKHDELGNMGYLVPTMKKVYQEHMPHFLKITYYYKENFNL
jgi:hypothetical protein